MTSILGPNRPTTSTTTSTSTGTLPRPTNLATIYAYRIELHSGIVMYGSGSETRIVGECEGVGWGGIKSVRVAEVNR